MCERSSDEFRIHLAIRRAEASVGDSRVVVAPREEVRHRSKAAAVVVGIKALVVMGKYSYLNRIAQVLKLQGSRSDGGMGGQNRPFDSGPNGGGFKRDFGGAGPGAGGYSAGGGDSFGGDRDNKRPRY